MLDNFRKFKNALFMEQNNNIPTFTKVFGVLYLSD